MIEYEVGSRPSTGLTLLIRDEFDNPVNIVGYSSWQLEMLDSDNQLVDMSGVNIREIPSVIGGLAVIWPKDRTIFNKRGEYVLRLVFNGHDGAKDITRATEIKVREFGRIK